MGLLMLFGTVRPGTAQNTQPIDTFFDEPYSPEYEKKMVSRINGQISRFFDRYRDRVTSNRAEHWNRDFSSAEAYHTSIAPNRARFREIIGLKGARVPVEVEQYASNLDDPVVGETDAYRIRQIRWSVLDGVDGVGLLLTPKQAIQAQAVVLPEADQTPEQLVGLQEGIDSDRQYPRMLAANGVQVIVPVLLNRNSTFSRTEEAVPRLAWENEEDEYSPLETNMAHREWIYRQAYVLGRHVIGLEIQKVLGAIDWFQQQAPENPLPIGVAGYGEGGLLAMYTSAVDRRVDATLVSGYFGPRENLWKEPVYRNVWGLLKQFGDAEIASMIAPRALTIEYSQGPVVEGDLPTGDETNFDASGRLQPHSYDAVAGEVERLRGLFPDNAGVQLDLDFVHGPSGRRAIGPGSEEAVTAFARDLAIDQISDPGAPPEDRRSSFDASARQGEQVTQLTDFLHDIVYQKSDFNKYRYVDGDWSSAAAWNRSMEKYRDSLYSRVIGRLPEYDVDPNVQRRQVFDRDSWTGYEILIEILPGVKAWGLLAIPKDLEDGEERPAVVVQHGHAGTPTTPVRVDSYNNILPRLCQRGFVVFAPYNPYQFNVRKATPLKTSVYSVLIPQHQRIVDYLQSLDAVDGDRIGFYGKSWGGRTALRVGPYVKEYSPIISAAYANQWPRKVMTVHRQISYMTTGSLGVYEFNQGNTFGHAEMAMMIVPRPFMFEAGYQDGVAPDEWVAFEYAKVKRVYDLLGIGSRIKLGNHMGGHEVHADTIFPFLHEYLQWPAPATK